MRRHVITVLCLIAACVSPPAVARVERVEIVSREPFAAGAEFGTAGAYAVGRLLMSLIPSLPSGDPIAVVIMGAVLVGVALLACYVPARGATKVDPLVALRNE